MKTPKQQLSELLDRLPDDASMDTLLYEMYFVASVRRGLEQAERGEGISHDEVERRLARWRATGGKERLFRSS